MYPIDIIKRLNFSFSIEFLLDKKFGLRPETKASKINKKSAFRVDILTFWRSKYLYVLASRSAFFLCENGTGQYSSGI